MGSVQPFTLTQQLATPELIRSCHANSHWRPTVAMLILVTDQNGGWEHGKFILILKRKSLPDGSFSDELKYDIPKGGVEEDESPQRSIVRETFEETGIQIAGNEIKYLGQMYVPFDGDSSRYSDEYCFGKLLLCYQVVISQQQLAHAVRTFQGSEEDGVVTIQACSFSLEDVEHLLKAQHRKRAIVRNMILASTIAGRFQR